MATLQDYLNQVRAIVHDTNAANFTDSTLTSFINQARVRVAQDFHCVRNFLSVTGGSALNTIGQQENYYYSGTVGGITVTSGGANYSENTTVTLTGGAGAGATASPVIIDGVITAINMTNWGQGYGAAPTVVITDSTGTGAAAIATPLVNILDILSVTVIWGSTRIIFEYVPFTAFQTFMRQWTQQYSVPSVFTLIPQLSQMFLFQIPDQVYTMEWDVISLPDPLVNPGDIDAQVIAPWNDGVQFFAAHLCMASLGNLGMADYWYDGRGNGKYDRRVVQLPARAFVRRIYNPTATYLKMIRRL